MTKNTVYTTSNIINFIEKAFGKGKVNGRGDNIQVVCPICKLLKGEEYSKTKLAIKLTSPNVVHCWVCGYRSRHIGKLIKKYAPQYKDEYYDNFLSADVLSADRDDEEHKKHKSVTLPNGFTFLLHADDGEYTREAVKYLLERGIKNKADIWYWKFGITRNAETGCKNRIIIPSFDKEGNLNYWSARSWLSRPKLKYKNPECDRREIIFNELNVDWSKELTLVEGPFDVIKCNQNAAAVLGSYLDGNYKLFQEIVLNETPVALAFDNEPSAQKKQLQIANLLSSFNISVRVVQLPEDKDVGDLNKSEFLECLEKAPKYNKTFHMRKRIMEIV